LLVDDAGVPADGRAVQRHCLGLLTLLAGERRGLSRDRIVGFLWPDCDETTARHRLSVALHVLRKRLGDDAITAHGDALRLDSSRWEVDAWRFEEDVARGQFEAARCAWSGPLLDGFYLRRAASFEQWLERWRGRLARRYAAVLEALAQQAEDRGDLEACVGFRQELIVSEPCSSAHTVGLMRSLAALGREEGAIQCSRAYTLLIREEYGLEPDPAVLACADALVRASGIVATAAAPR
jgi:DNA-binding SARP family transcriptional activator